MEGVGKVIIEGFYPISPKYSFKASYYLSNRVVREQPDFSETIVTQEKYERIDKGFTDFWEIQKIVLRKYSISFFIQENSENIQIQNGDKLTITFEDNEEHHAVIIGTPEFEKQQNTQTTRVTILYKDVNSRNYRDNNFPVLNRLRSDAILDQYTALVFDNSIRFRLNTTKDVDDYFNVSGLEGTTSNISIFSKLIPELRNELLSENNDIQVQGVRYQTNVKISSVGNARFYLNESDLFNIEKYIKTADNISLINPTKWTINALESVDYTVNKLTNGIDIYQIDFKLRYDILDFSYHSATSEVIVSPP